MTREEFLQEIRETVMTLWADFQILPSIAAAQAAHESGNGQSDLAQNGNALFGIKVANGVCDGPGEPVSFDDPSWTGGVICHLTWEHIDGEDIQVYDTFRIYDSWGASIQDYADYLHVRGLYDAVIGETDYLVAAQALFDAGYATDPNYVERITTLIEEYQLTDWDEEALSASGGSEGATSC
ncbi:glycoside hydrolase family 73 protein [Geomicrobium sp. JSM 1781026]|uniref:glycoside hydrolase family 73 protein n=1 Tax=Geomicrobium sp. JSM 1781026 TaxID=3344580 RepID=UPI0035C166E2